jgi:NADH:ubiquinone oxidoreductase subunit 6 (subunit J)
MSDGSRGLGRWGVRLLAVFGVCLILAGGVGWWMSTRVLDANGFADVAAKASAKQEVRDYVADQATLRLARTSNFVSAARPAVRDAVSAAIDTPPVRQAVYDFVLRAHQQVFQVQGARRVDVDSSEAAATIRTALQTINPALAKKVPAGVLDATTTISQSGLVDLLFRISPWVNALWLPFLVAGAGVLVVVVWKARDRVRAIRIAGVTMAIAGGLGLGIGAATPGFAYVAATNDPGRGDAVAAFIEVLTGRLVGFGQALVLLGMLLALAPGHDGGDLADRVSRIRAWFAEKRTRPRWRFAGGVALILVAFRAITDPASLSKLILLVFAVLVIYVGIVVCLRASGAMVTDHSIPKLHKRQIVAVFASMIVAIVFTATVAVGIVSNSTEQAKANPSDQGCNGYIELCALPINQMIWPASHNAMSSAAYDFFGAEHTITIPEQLNAGARFFMLDAYYGYDDNGLVRTNLAGGVNKSEVEKEHGADAVHELNRLGALTGAADISGKKQDVYFCHDFCELGAVKANDILANVRQFLETNLTDVVILDVEDYVQPKDLKKALIDADLFDRVYTPQKKNGRWPTLYEMVVPKKKNATENPRRLIVMSEKHPDVYKWLLGTYNVSQETPFTFQKISDFNCKPNRGKTGKSFFIVNHWLRPDGPPDPVEAAQVNSSKVLTKRLSDCIAQRQALPTALAVDFTAIGDLYKTVNKFNAAIARQAGVTKQISLAIKQIRDNEKLTPEQVREITDVHRLPKISAATTRKLLGSLTDKIKPAPKNILKQLADPTPPTTTTTAEPPPTTEPDSSPDQGNG